MSDPGGPKLSTKVVRRRVTAGDDINFVVTIAKGRRRPRPGPARHPRRERTAANRPVITGSTARNTASARSDVSTATRRPQPGPGHSAIAQPVAIAEVPPVPPVAELTRARHRDHRDLTPRRRWPLAVALGAFALSIAIPVLVQTLGSDSRTESGSGSDSSAVSQTRPTVHPTPATASPSGSLLAWARQNLSRQSVVAADASTAAALRSAGFGSVVELGKLPGRSLFTVDYLVTSPSADQPTGRAQAAYRSAARLSLPVAEFGSGAQARAVREIVPSGLSDVQRQIRQDAALRREGGSELDRNAAVHLSPTDRATLARGALDLRAQDLLAVLSANGPVYVRGLHPIAAEQRAGLPIRSMTITTANAESMQAVISGLLAPYRPDTVQAISSRTFTVGWSPTAQPLTPVGG